MFIELSAVDVSSGATDFEIVGAPGVGKALIFYTGKVSGNDMQGHIYETDSNGRDLGPLSIDGRSQQLFNLQTPIKCSENVPLIFNARVFTQTQEVAVFYKVIDV